MADSDNPTADVPSTDDHAKGIADDNPGIIEPNRSRIGRNGADTSDSAQNDSEDAEPEGSLDQGTRQTLALVQAYLESREESYTGLLPHPEHWDKFDPDVQERILRMSESFTTDESVRRDKLVDANIEESRKGRQNALLLMGASFVAVFLAQWLFGNAWLSALFLGYPVFQAISMFIPSQKGNGNKRPESDS